jgi:hypothetical protein
MRGGGRSAAVLVGVLVTTVLHPMDRVSAAESRHARAPIEIVQLTDEERAIPPEVLSPDQAARVLMEVAERFEGQGELAAARLLYREVVERYADTVHAARAQERLDALEVRPGSGTDLPPIPPDTAPPTGSETVTPPVVPPSSIPAAGSTTFENSSGLDQSGRLSVIAYSTLLSTWVALAVPIYAEAEGSEEYGLALLVGAPAGLVASVYATRDRQVTAQQADIYVLAGNMGIWHGLALGLVNDWEGHETAGATALGGLLGAATGAVLIAPGRTRETSAALTSLAAPYGIWYGFLLAEMLDDDTVDEDDPVPVDDDDDSTIGAMLLGGDAALIGSVLVMKNITLSRDRARLIGVAGAAGGLFGGAIDLLLKVEGNTAWALVAAGTTGGLVAGVALTADYDVNRGFSDPPRGALEDRLAPDFAVLPLHLKTLKPAGPNSQRWRESLESVGLVHAPSIGLTLFEARF